MLACLAKIMPLDPVLGERVPVYVSAHNDGNVGRVINGLGGYPWQPAMTTLPVLDITLFNGDFTASVEVAQASLAVNLGILTTTYPDIGRYFWSSAPIEIYAEKPGTIWPWKKRFVGKIADMSIKDVSLTLTCTVDSEPFMVDLLSLKYAGTSGAEGPVDIKDKPKPLILGWASNVEPQQIDAVNNVYQFSAYGAIEAVTKLYERGSDFGNTTGDYATYAALVAATVPAGRWATCLAEGMVRLGAPAAGVITGDVKGVKVGSATPRLAGAIIQKLASIAGIDTALINTDSLDAVDAAVPYPMNLVVADQEKFLDAARGMMLGCNAQAGIGFDGRLFAARVDLDADARLSIDAAGRSYPQVIDCDEMSVSPPYWRIVLGANRCWRVHSTSEIAFAAPFVPMGLYSATTTYREGNIVSLANGSEWLYILQTATSGNAPPTWPTTSNTWWQNTKPPLNASGITYADGTAIEALKPAEPGSDVTSNQQVTIEAVSTRTINADYAGTIASGVLPAAIAQPKVVKGGTTITTANNVSYAIQNAAGGCSGNVTVDNTNGSASKGVVTIGTGFNASGSYELVITVDGTAYPAIKVTVSKANGAPPAGGGGSTSGSFDPNAVTVSSTSYAEIGRVSDLTVASGKTVYAYLSGNYVVDATTNATRTMSAKWQYSVAGANSWTDFATAATGTSATLVYGTYDQTLGSITCNQTKAGLSAGNYDIRLVASESSAANSSVLSFDGLASASVSVS